jgi:PPM family protein phosphatase
MNEGTENDSAEYYLPFHGFDSQGIEAPLSSRIEVEFGAVSDRGKVRRNNQDAFLIYQTGRFWQRINSSLPDVVLPDDYRERAYTMIVADGIGGLPAGEEASKTALTTIVNLVLSSVKWSLKLNDPETRSHEILEGLERGMSYLRKADLAISRRAKRHGAYKGMGTTLTAAHIHSDDLFIFHVGDSRAYLFRNGKLLQITRDHTVAQDLADAGLIPQSDVPNHQFKHLLTRAVGVHEGKLDVELHHLKLADADTILLCSDGLYDFVKAETITGVLSSGASSQEKCDSLLDLAMRAGGKDNITVVIGCYTIP